MVPNGCSTESRRWRILPVLDEPLLNVLKNVFVLPAGNPAFLARSATRSNPRPPRSSSPGQNIDRPNRIVVTDPVFQPLGKPSRSEHKVLCVRSRPAAKSTPWTSAPRLPASGRISIDPSCKGSTSSPGSRPCRPASQTGESTRSRRPHDPTAATLLMIAAAGAICTGPAVPCRALCEGEDRGELAVAFQAVAPRFRERA